MSDHIRQPSGTPKGGQFASTARAEPDVVLDERPQHPAGPDPFGEQAGEFVDSVLTGPLSRGVVPPALLPDLRRWHSWAEMNVARTRLDDPDGAAAYDQFAAGLEHAVIALMSDKAEFRRDYIVSEVTWELGSHPRPGDWAKARRILTEKRTSKGSRSEWARMLQDAPTEPARRGAMTAAAVLSGLDGRWGLRDDQDRTAGVT